MKPRRAKPKFGPVVWAILITLGAVLSFIVGVVIIVALVHAGWVP